MLYERIVDLCKQRDIRIADICRATGMRQSVFTDLKAGRSKTLAAHNLQRIADYFGVTVDFLLTGDSEPKAETVSDVLADAKRRLGSAAHNGEPLTDNDKQLMYDAIDMLSTHFSNVRKD